MWSLFGIASVHLKADLVVQRAVMSQVSWLEVATRAIGSANTGTGGTFQFTPLKYKKCLDKYRSLDELYRSPLEEQQGRH